MSHLLEVRGLVTRFYTKTGVANVVNGISYTLDAGESMAIVGESGSGKSVGVLSLIRLIPSPPGRIDGGEVIFKGQDLVQLPEQEIRKIRGREIAMVFQDPMTSLNPVLTIGRQITESLKLHLNMTGNEARERAIEMLELVSIPNPAGRLKDYPHQLSGGQRQRVMIAMALSCNPSLLIADEPTTALDVTIQAQIVELVKDLQKKFGMAIIWITHDLGVVAGLVSKVAVMYAGVLVEMAPVRELYKQTSHPYTQGLLSSIPVLDAKEKQRLVSIDGLPPDLFQKNQHCPFAPRCRYAVDQCWAEKPPLLQVGPDHYSACWRWEEVRRKAGMGLSRDWVAL